MALYLGNSDKLKIVLDDVLTSNDVKNNLDILFETNNSFMFSFIYTSSRNFATS